MGLTRRPVLRLFVATLVAAAACASEAGPGAEEPAELPAEEPASQESEAEQAADTLPGAIPPITISHVSNIHPERFPHHAHETVACGACHTVIPGHAGHMMLDCAACHVAAPGERARPTPAECDACHHGAQQTRTCAGCHGDRPRPVRQVEFAVRFSVRDSPAAITLPFEHDRHAGLECSVCHGVQAAVREPRACASCHESHHGDDRRCSACHAPMPLDTHDRNAHLGCGGAGCHQDAAVTALAQTRPVCLVCHRQQEDHEPGQDCARCHIFTDTGTGGAAWQGQ